MPKKTWEQSVKCDIRKYGMQRVKPFDKDKWRSCCEFNYPTRASMEKNDVINSLNYLGQYNYCFVYIEIVLKYKSPVSYQEQIP